ncbi:RAMP superfamily CRISPR-associated protein [Cronbergia sp. UHCC 0137]|uniref:RAMP superfamily CRISPR-associated protein n=1 Tax=Cronbergia sp. UHCC 0137 TaxID=3110239 RepID=UPI002B205E05|nr:RAMP superfamily CRISPR-associated protein [Cronbergia sp. UHCC 0137]MEA5619867.1 RAMP superfamily CRISPR-associated protein [Cronbergia sp. UHCC 0137]
MARKISSRIKVSGQLIAQTPIHVGGVGGNPQIDLPLAVNGQGKYYIPGTSLAGAFRSWIEDSQKANSVWGYQQEKDAEGHASFILVEDAPIQGINAEIRDGVGIHREWGTAAEKAKYDRAILPKGCKIPLNMTLEVPFESSEEATEYKNSFASLIKALEKGEIRLGAAKTRGLGKVQLFNFSIRESNLSQRDGILKALQGKDEIINSAIFLQSSIISSRRKKLTFEINWQPQSPLMVKAEGNGIAVDILPLVSAIDRSLTFVLPGSSIKGAFRFQAERIIRTVCPSLINRNVDFLDQIEVPLVNELFGTRAKAKKETKKGIGSLFIDDCYANIPITPSAWGNMEAATNENDLRKALDNANLQNVQQAFHVAVDRWTGGAADGMLYSNLELMKINWKPIYLTLDIDRISNNKLPAISLLLLCLRDLVDGRIPLGYGTNRGMGSIKVNSIVIKGDNLESDLKEFTNVTLVNGSLTNLDCKFLETLNNHWKQWIDTQNKEGK